ncbi:hypothetical protein ACTXT7_011886 [Hymenolepis weldensis]
MFPDVPNTSNNTFSTNSSENSVQSPVVHVSPWVLPTPVQAANADMKLPPSVRDSVKVTNLTHSVEFSMPKVIPETTVLLD